MSQAVTATSQVLPIYSEMGEISGILESKPALSSQSAGMQLTDCLHTAVTSQTISSPAGLEGSGLPSWYSTQGMYYPAHR